MLHSINIIQSEKNFLFGFDVMVAHHFSTISPFFLYSTIVLMCNACQQCHLSTFAYKNHSSPGRRETYVLYVHTLHDVIIYKTIIDVAEMI